MINKIDIIITTMDRYDRLEMLLDSIYKYYPEAKVTVADQSDRKEKSSFTWDFYEKYTTEKGLTVLYLNHDCGLSYARNYLIKHTNRPYILLLEDDFLFTEDTKIEKLYELMEISDIAGGGVYQNDIRIPFEFNFEAKGDTLCQVSDGDVWFDDMIGRWEMNPLDREYFDSVTTFKMKTGKYKKKSDLWDHLREINRTAYFIKYKQTQCILNFFLAKRLVFNDILWYDKLKLAEHQHFFYRLSRETAYKVVYTPDVKIVDNKGHQSSHYTALRTRQEFFAESIRDLGFKRLKYLNGRVAEVNGDNIKYYYEKI